jgi:hypothetical protein
MRYGVSFSRDYKDGTVVIRDFQSEPKGRVLCIIVRDNRYEAEQTAQHICDLLNNDLKNHDLGTV